VFTDDDVIHSYSRAQALDDGVLVDAGKLAEEAGFRFPVALTRSAWDQYVAVPDGVSGQDEQQRLRYLLGMLRFAVSLNGGMSELRFMLDVETGNDECEFVILKAVCGPNDDASPCITVMMLDED
jgi:hypothetical protein